MPTDPENDPEIDQANGDGADDDTEGQLNPPPDDGGQH
jgi:hypothetical protein